MLSTKKDEPIIVPLFIQDAEGGPPPSPDTPLYESRAGAPIIAPDGHHVTFGEFSTVTGRIRASCLPTGTQTILHLNGLIPNATYTVWNATFNAPGFDPTAPDLNVRGQGVIGPLDGGHSVFTSSSQGRGQIVATTPGGALSMFGSISACALAGEIEWHAVGAYHIDGQSHGGDLGPDGSAVEQFAFIFRSDEL